MSQEEKRRYEIYFLKKKEELKKGSSIERDDSFISSCNVDFPVKLV